MKKLIILFVAISLIACKESVGYWELIAKVKSDPCVNGDLIFSSGEGDTISIRNISDSIYFNSTVGHVLRLNQNPQTLAYYIE